MLWLESGSELGSDGCASWEAAGVRQLLVDQVDEVAQQYQDAKDEIRRRHEAAELADPEVNDTDYVR
ncbi:hypothetical protein ACLM5J_03765 [Nocardioides sp. Bht2]|uniref:hypothetical protein n=1 Tax=Nocardioides sp. Bht2 TaxID=3392297 RepID=UPI0039B440E4